MAVIDYNSQIRYSGPGPMDAKMQPVNSFSDLSKISSASRYPGMTITVLQGDNGKPQDYWFVGPDRFSGSWVKKIDDFSLEISEDGALSLTYNGDALSATSIDLVPAIENVVKDWYLDSYIKSGEIVSSGDSLNMILYYNEESEIEPIVIDLSPLKEVFPSLKDFNELYDYAHSLGELSSGGTVVTSGKGIEIKKSGTTSEINVKLMESQNKTTSGSNKNFIEYVDDSIAVMGMDADVSVITEDIKVAGLTNQLGSGEYQNNSIIPAGTSLQEILQNLFCKELWNNSNIEVNTYFDVSLNNDSQITMNANSKLEIGQAVKVSQFNANSTNTPKQSYTIGTFDYGYAWDNNGSGATTAKTYSQSLVPTLADNTNRLVENFIGFKNETGGTIATVYGTDSVPEITIYPSKGNNRVIIEQSGWTYNSASAESRTMYIATNLGNYYQQDKIQDNTFSPLIKFEDSKTAIKRLEKGIDAYYAMYMGCIPIEKDYTNYFYSKESLSSLTYSLMVQDEIVIDDFTSETLKPSMAIVIPNLYQITSMKNSLGAPIDVFSNFVKYNEIRYKNGPFETIYDVYILSSSDKITYKEIKINKR